jgi:hypothetical protein
MAEAFQYKTILANVRPPRLAVLIDENDSYWRDTCLRVIENCSELWGGAYNIIIPTDGNTIREEFWELLDFYDPDYFYCYRQSGADLELAAKEKFDAIVSRDVKSWLQSVKSSDEGSVREQCADNLRKYFLNEFQISDSLNSQILKRLSPFYFESTAVQHSMSARSIPGFPLTKTLDILPNSPAPRAFSKLEGCSPILSSLWLASVFGASSPNYYTQLNNLGLSTNEFAITGSNDSDLLDQTMKWPAGHLIGIFGVSLAQLSFYRSRSFIVDRFEEPAAIIAGDSVHDFCFYYTLSRMRDRVIWASNEICSEPDYANLLTSMSMHLPGPQGRNGPTFFSISLGESDLHIIADRILIKSVRKQIKFTRYWKELLRHPRQLFETHTTGRPLAGLFEGTKIAGFVDTPKPLNFSRLSVDHRWISHLDIPDYVPPYHSKLGKHFLGVPGIGTLNARTAKDGLAYTSPTNGFYGGGSVDEVLVRPTLDLMGATQMFQRLCLGASITAVPSDKGLYSDDLLRKFRTLEAAADFFKNQRFKALFDKYLDTRSPEPGVYDEGAFVQGRRYLDFCAVEKIIHNKEEAATVLNTLCTNQILIRGFVFQCQACRNADWYPIAEVSETFVCSRCRSTQAYHRTHWKRPEEPAWYYALGEVSFQAHKNNAWVNILALDCLRRSSSKPFMFATEHDLFEWLSKERMMEIDMCCVWCGKVVIGEAKKNGVLGDNRKEQQAAAAKYRALADRINAYRIVCATAAAEWDKSAIDCLDGAFVGSSCDRILLAGKDIL